MEICKGCNHEFKTRMCEFWFLGQCERNSKDAMNCVEVCEHWKCNYDDLCKRAYEIGKKIGKMYAYGIEVIKDDEINCLPGQSGPKGV